MARACLGGQSRYLRATQPARLLEEDAVDLDRRKPRFRQDAREAAIPLIVADHVFGEPSDSHPGEDRVADDDHVVRAERPIDGNRSAAVGRLEFQTAGPQRCRMHGAAAKELSGSKAPYLARNFGDEQTTLAQTTSSRATSEADCRLVRPALRNPDHPGLRASTMVAMSNDIVIVVGFPLGVNRLEPHMVTIDAARYCALTAQGFSGTAMVTRRGRGSRV
jgi:hypothetical protein